MRSTSNFNRLGDFQVDFENLFDHILGNQPASSALKLVPPANVVESETGIGVKCKPIVIDIDQSAVLLFR